MHNRNKSLFPIADGYVINLGISENNILDKQWVQECEGLWFRPVRLDAIHGSYTCYWYGDRNSTGSFHYHSGTTDGISLRGSIVFTDLNSNITRVNSNQYVYIPAGVTHKAEIVIDPLGFLFYGSIDGNITYLDENNKIKFDVFDYIDLAEKHYKDVELDIKDLNRIIMR